MIYGIEWPETPTLPDHRRNYDWNVERIPKEDGFPRITTEGVEILKEGLRGDFSRWVWGIGNHPLELPTEHTCNLSIHAEDETPHFYASFWYGRAYPQTKKHMVLTPWFCFDQVDDLNVVDRDAISIRLRQSSDFWAHLTILLDDHEECATQEKAFYETARPSGCNPNADLDDEEPEEVILKPTVTLDKWGLTI